VFVPWQAARFVRIISTRARVHNVVASSALRSSDDRLRIFVESVNDYAFILFDRDNRVTEWNLGAERILGYADEEIVGRSGSVFFTPEDRESRQPEKEMATALRDGRAEDERWHLRKDGSRFRASGVMSILRDESGAHIGYAKVMRDVTEREEAREKLEASVREKTVLLREIHHRVKNNLQVVVSLISLQASHVTDASVLGMFEETQNRVRAIASIHETLYSTDDLATIHFGMYLGQLVDQVAAFYGVRGRVELSVDAADMALDIEQAIPLALIGNELLCNAFKHAFPDDRQGRVSVGLRYSGPAAGARIAEFEVSDDGRGLPDAVDFRTAQSMGFHLVHILTRQLKASAEIVRGQGTSFRVQFPIAND
jgi:PAS domain S-box-containing protein